MDSTSRSASRILRLGALLTAGVVSVVAGRRVEAHEVAARHATKSVTISSYAFRSPVVTVKRGTTVVWTNQDDAIHTVSFATVHGAPHDSSDLAHGSTFRHRFTALGVFHYHCAYHPFMHGTVKVTH